MGKKYKIIFFVEDCEIQGFFFPGYRVPFLASESGSLQKYVNQS
jgi:hypothetical protein